MVDAPLGASAHLKRAPAIAMLIRFNDAVERALGFVLAFLFACLIATVFAQVAARNVFAVPLIWTLDVAQLLFVWCIFLGAAVAFRHGGHFVVDLLPPSFQRGRHLQRLIAILADAIVIYVLIRHGIILSEMGLTRLSPAIGISEVWFFIPIPLGAAFMGLFLIEILGREVRS